MNGWNAQNIWITADTHFNHPLMAQMRKYKSVKNMDKTLIANWNAVIKTKDMVWHLGDFSFGGCDLIKKYRSKLNGKICLVCLSNDTKTYIKGKGFVPYEKIKVGDEVLGVYKKKHKKLYLKFHKILDKQVYFYNGKMYITNNRTISMNVTPDHLLFIYPAYDECTALRYIKAKNFYYKKNSFLRVPTSGWLAGDNYNISDMHIKLLAWFVSEGTINTKQQIQIFQNEGTNLNTIIGLLKSENIKHSIYNGKKGYHKIIYISKKYSKYFTDYLPLGKLNIQYLIDILSPKQLNVFLYEYIKGDGHKIIYPKINMRKIKGDGYFFAYTKSKTLAEQLAYIGIITGKRTYIKKRIRNLNGKQFKIYNVSFNYNYSKSIAKNQFKKIKYSGTVYDFTTKLGNFLVERNGSMFFTGNCGNHDYKNKVYNTKNIFTDITFLKTVKYKGQKIILCHYAMRVWDSSHYNSYQLYGHSHGKLDSIGKQMDVGVDTNNLFPYHIEQVMDILAKKPDNFNFLARNPLLSGRG